MFRDAKRFAQSCMMKRRKRRVLANGEASPAWYDDAYSTVPEYNAHWSKSVYLPVWEAICNEIEPNAKVLEIGCGSGQLARMLRELKRASQYVGFDFSETAVDMARSQCPTFRFEVADAYVTDLYTTVDYDTVICTEVLEHISEDLHVLRRLNGGVRVLATVPNFDWDSHVRHFASGAEVRKRYGPLFNDLEISEHLHAGDKDGHGGRFFLMDGRLRSS